MDAVVISDVFGTKAGAYMATLLLCRALDELEIKVQGNMPLISGEWINYYVPFKKRSGGFGWTEAGRPDFLLRNDGLGNFTDVTGPSGIALGRALQELPVDHYWTGHCTGDRAFTLLQGVLGDSLSALRTGARLSIAQE